MTGSHPLIKEAEPKAKLKVLFCTPSRKKAHPAYFEAMEKSIPLIIGAGFDECYCFETGNPYISGPRANMLKRGLDAKCDIFVFLDDDLSWEPEALLKLVQTPGDVVGGTYRCKEADFSDNYMGRILQSAEGRPTSIRADGCIECSCLPAGFLKVTKEAVFKFMMDYPELCYGPPWSYAVDLFNHGAHKGLWWGEDYAFCRNWRDKGGQVWLVPDLNINHHDWNDPLIDEGKWDEAKVYRGNFHEYLQRQPGGAKDPNRARKFERSDLSVA